MSADERETDRCDTDPRDGSAADADRAFGAGIEPGASSAPDAARSNVDAAPIADAAPCTALQVVPPLRVIVGRRVRRARAPRVRPTSRAWRATKIALAAIAAICALAFLGVQIRRGVQAGVGTWVAGDVSSDGASLRRVAWAEPEPHGPSAAIDAGTTRVALAPDGRRAIVAHGERGHDSTLWLVELDGDRVESERPLHEIDAPGDELAPWFDGNTLWFASDRAGGRGGLDLWSARFVDGSFERAEHLAGDANSAADDTDPTVHGARLAFASDRAGTFDVWSTGAHGGPAARIDALATSADEREPAYATDGGSLWIARRDGASFDLARAFRHGDRWLAAERVDALSTDADERAPSPLGAGIDVAYLRTAGAPVLMRARSVELFAVPARAWTIAEIALFASLIALAALAWFARDVSRYDTLIAAWAASVLVHVIVMLALGPLRSSQPIPSSEGDGSEPFRMRLAPSTQSESLTGGGRGGGVGVERADTTRELGGSALASASDLSSAIAAPTERAPVPGRDAASGPAGSSRPRALTESSVSEIPRGAIADARADLPASAPTTRGVATEGPAPGLERYASAVGARDPSSSSAPFGSPLALATQASEAPASERGTSTAVVARASALELDEREGTGTPQPGASGAADAERAADVFAALAPGSTSSSGTSARADAEPVLERFERGDGDASKSAGSSREIAFAPGGSSLLDDLPRAPAPSSGSVPRADATPYQTREGAAKQRALEEHGGTRATETAVAKGLDYLARIQGDLGQWGPIDARDEKYGEICVGKTALATLAFLAAGHTHVSKTQHSRTVERALAFLLAVQDPESAHYGDTSAYSHGIATFALAEAFATTRDDSLRESVERAVAHVLARQSRDPDPRKFGGWPYYYPDPQRTFDPWPRTSITAWQVLALESARISGIDVPDRAFDDAARFLEAARDERADWYRYSHEPARLRSSYPTLPASTPAALFALSCIGRDVKGPEHAGARRYVLERAPRGYRFTNERDFVERAQGNPYFWYQGTLAMFRVGGNEWKRWNVALQETLLPAQDDDGSWKPIDVYARYARDDEHDRAYTTALCVLCLEVYYRYDLPLLSAGRASIAPIDAATPR